MSEVPKATDPTNRSSDDPAVVGYHRQLKTADAAVTEATRFLDQQIRQTYASLKAVLDEEDPVDVVDPDDDSRPFRAFSSSSIVVAAKLP